MAAYAALTSLMRVIHDLQHHPSPPISLDNRLLDSITQRVAFFQQFLHSYITSPVVADRILEMPEAYLRTMHDLEQGQPASPISIHKQLVDSITRRIIYFDEFLVSCNRPCPVLDCDEEPVDPTAISIASASYSSLVYLMLVIHDIERRHLSSSLDLQLADSIIQRVQHFQELLQSYYSNPSVVDGDEEEVADPLEMRIAASAHAAEDAIEYHIVDCVKHKKKYKKDDKRCCGVLQSVIEEMDSIKKEVSDDTQRKKKVPEVLVIMTNVPVAISVVSSPNETMSGSDIVVIEIMEKLAAGGKLDCQVIPIVGMGGIGKTFLAKTIYAKPFIKERFDICAWTTISQHYDMREILCELLSQATNTNKEQLSGKSEDELGLELHQHLFSRRFLIVMDDMWSIDSWDKIQRFFPNNCNGSRVLVTTRLSQLSLQLNNDEYSLRMSFLDKTSSWELFSRTVFGEKSSTCPPELKQIGEEIVDNCRGLPLSIAVVGGLLKKMDATTTSWKSIRGNFASVVNMENDKHCLRLLKLSYDHLPVYLKPCFLHMGVFEKDEKIRVATLVQLWVSEGFLKPTKGEALETTARRFLQDLVDRNLVLIDELGSTGTLRFCKMHDLVRDMCTKECKKQGFYHVIGQLNPCPPPPPRGMNTQRRVLIPRVKWEENVRRDLRFMYHTRSIICKRGKVPLFRNLELLRTLEARKKSLYSNNEIHLSSVAFHHVNLRHLSIATPSTSSFLTSVSRLWNLHTLIVDYSFSSEPALIPDFWNMPQFRHIEFIEDCVHLPDPPNFHERVVVMENLHTLKGVRNLKCSEGVVKRIPNIKRLKVEYKSGDGDVDINDVFLFGNTKDLCGLEFLSVGFLDVGVPIAPMHKFTFPHSLKKLSLCVEFELEFEWDDVMLEKIGYLPLLEKLKLSHGFFGKGKWEISQGQFPCLKYLQLYMCRGLVSWKASEDDSSSILPRLEHLKLDYLFDLKEIPFELGNIDTLKSIKLFGCGEKAVKSMKEMFDEQVDLQGGADQLSFHVAVDVGEKQQHLLSLTGPNFYVNTSKNIWF